MITQTYDLNLIPNSAITLIRCSQYDSESRTLTFNLYNGAVAYEVPSGAIVTVRGTKKDNTGFEYQCSSSGSEVSVEIKDQMTIFAGTLECELRITYQSKILGTANFILEVEKTTLAEDIIVSETQIPLIEEASQAADRAESAAQVAEAEADRAENEADRAEAAAALSEGVKTVNHIEPDASGNVELQTLPSGGTAGQTLIKQSSTDGDADWEDIRALPTGGTQGQFLVKASSDYGDSAWETKEVELTQAEYDALPASKLTDGVSYYIKDGESAPSANRFSASGISYDNTDSGLSATNVQDAVDSLDSEIKASTKNNISVTASSETDFISQVLDNLLSWGIGSYVFGATRTGYYACTCFGSVTTSTRCIVQIIPQPANVSKVFLGESNGGTKSYKQIATTALS